MTFIFVLLVAIFRLIYNVPMSRNERLFINGCYALAVALFSIVDFILIVCYVLKNCEASEIAFLGY
jgi:hypothetical protein